MSEPYRFHRLRIVRPAKPSAKQPPLSLPYNIWDYILVLRQPLFTQRLTRIQSTPPSHHIILVMLVVNIFYLLLAVGYMVAICDEKNNSFHRAAAVPLHDHTGTIIQGASCLQPAVAYYGRVKEFVLRRFFKTMAIPRLLVMVLPVP